VDLLSETESILNGGNAKVALSTIKQTTNICLSTDTGLDQRVDSKEMLIDTSDNKYIKYTYL
jgi:hypothetical protein